MKIRKFLILLLMVFSMVALFVSCGYRQPGFTWPSTQVPSIVTSAVEVKVIRGSEKGEKLRVEFNPETGKCDGLLFFDEKGEKIACDDIKRDFIFKLEDTYFCTPPDEMHPANTDIDNNGSRDVYCGKVLFLTEGADIQYKSDSTAGNRVCKNVGGIAICYPPIP